MRKILLLEILVILLIGVGFVASDNSPAPIVVTSQNNFSPNPVVGSIPNYTPPQPSQQQMDCFNLHGCYLSSTCYLSGSVISGTVLYKNSNNWIVQTENTSSYCSGIISPGMSDNYAFLNQSPEGQSCTQNYECTTGVCSDNLCINVTKLAVEYAQLKVQLENLNQSVLNNNQTNNSQEDTDLSTKVNATNETSLTRVTSNVISNTSSNNNLFGQVLDFFRRLFS